MAHNKKIMIDHAQQCVQPAIDYTFLHPSASAFKAEHDSSPQKAHEMLPTASSIDCLKAFPFFDGKDLEGLKVKLPTYLAEATDVDSSIDPMHWWQLLPRWVLLVQPSSAASERVFSSP